MAKDKQNSDDVPAWLNSEIGRSERQAETGETVNARASAAVRNRSEPIARNKRPAKPKVKRINKGFQVEEDLAREWDILVAKMKSNPTNKRTGPELIEEGIRYIIKKYSS